jgi:hypothetical protein
MQILISYREFVNAVLMNNDQYTADLDKFNDEDEPGYHVFNIKELRQFIQPIPR